MTTSAMKTSASFSPGALPEQNPPGSSESEHVLGLFVQHMPAAVAMLDESFRYVMVSSRWVADFDLAGREGLKGQSHFSLFADPEEQWRAAFERAREGGVVQGEETPLHRRDGRVYWVRWEARPWYREEGGGGIILLAEDKTARKQAEEALAASKHLLSSVLVTALDGIMVFEAVRDDQGRIQDFRWLLANPRAEELTGRTVEELLGKRLLQEMPGNRDAGLFDAYVRVVETGEPATRELRYAHEGVEAWFHLTAVRVGDGFAVTFRNITASKQSEQALRDSEARFRLLAENMSDLVCLHEPDGRYTYVSPSVRRILGYRPPELVGQDPFRFMHPEDAARLQQEGPPRLFSSAPVEKATYRARTSRDGYVWLETTTKPIRDAHGKITQLLTSSRDVSERVRAEQAMERTNRALEQRNRELQDFAYVASHDLQEPLRKVRAFAELLRDDYGAQLDEMGQYYVERMKDGATRMAQLISDLLAYSRVTTKRRPFTPVDLNEVVAEVLSDLEVRISEAEGGVEVGALPTLEADGTQMHQLLLNLVGNALKFHRPGVRPFVRIYATIEPGSSPGDPPGSLSTKEVCYLSVQDNGIGFDQKYEDRIFTPFQRLHGRSVYEGTGMGLAICRRIVERHHGTIRVQSAPEEGTTFTAVLPVRQEEELTGTSSHHEQPA